MTTILLRCLAAFVCLSIHGSWAYTLSKEYNASNFADEFVFETSDPSHGFVQYVNQSSAVSNGIFQHQASVSIRPNAWLGQSVGSLQSALGGKPNSVRLVSKDTFTHGVLVIDVLQIPEKQCGLWSLLMTAGDNWPVNGGIKLFEQMGGAENNVSDRISLHANATCTMTAGAEEGQQLSTDCNDVATGNLGCAVAYSSNDLRTDIGTFLANGGGAFALVWTSQTISVYFWRRNLIPADIATNQPQPATWGRPAANFSGPCHIDEHFREQRISISTSFCGDLVDQIWAQECQPSTKSATCQAYVQSSYAMLGGGNWDFNYIKLFQEQPATQ
ncbi:MAG: hypothetical protein M1838_002086 [Thelocarpon superellum]|nr:MAG: hypothetical protein M1838_002086 [Thelocarpon superellum]